MKVRSIYVSFSLFCPALFMECGLCVIFGLVRSAASLAGAANPSPLTDEAMASEQVGLDIQMIVSCHMLIWVDAVECHRVHRSISIAFSGAGRLRYW